MRDIRHIREQFVLINAVYFEKFPCGWMFTYSLSKINIQTIDQCKFEANKSENIVSFTPHFSPLTFYSQHGIRPQIILFMKGPLLCFVKRKIQIAGRSTHGRPYVYKHCSETIYSNISLHIFHHLNSWNSEVFSNDT